MPVHAGEPFYKWTTFERGFDVPAALVEAVKAGMNLPRCDLCQDFPEKLELGQLIQPYIDSVTMFTINQQLVDTEVRIECHGHRWSLQGSQAQAYLNAMWSRD
jgi:hypothetical protein